MKEIIYSDRAQKFLTKIDREDSKRIRSKIKQYAANPEELKNKVTKLVGFPLYRLRVGDYRVIFSETGEVILIEKIGNRRDVYKGDFI